MTKSVTKSVTELEEQSAQPKPAKAARGWVLASSAEWLYGNWRGRARDADENAENWQGIVDVQGVGGDYYRGMAEGYRSCIKDLQAEMRRQNRAL